MMNNINAVFHLYQKLGTFDNPFLYIGKSGAVLFNAYLFKYTQKPIYYNQMLELLEECFHESGNFETENYCLNNLTGLGWLLQHLYNEGIIDLNRDNEKVLETIDGLVVNSIQKDVDNGNYDLIFGLIGKGIYFLERFKNNKILLKYHVNLVVDTLFFISEFNENGAFWRDKVIQKKYPTLSGVNLGFGHGLPGIISFLCNVYNTDIRKNEVSNYLKAAVKYLRSAESPYQCSLFANLEGIRQISRLAWCYGDLGVSFAFLKASKTLRSRSLKEESMRIGIKTANRDKNTALLNSNKQLGITETGFCHGTSGLAYMYYKMYRFSKENIFLKQHQYWLHILKEDLARIEKISKDKDSGFLFQKSQKTSRWISDNTLLEGASGIGMVLLSILSGNCSWDSIFLLDL